MKPSTALSPVPRRPPRLTQAGAALTREIEVLDEYGQRRRIHIPDERPLTLFVDKRELVTLMTLGAMPELLALGYLRNQRLVDSAAAVESVTVDWDVAAVAVRTHHGIEDLERKTARRVVTTGCGQGTVFGDMMDELHFADAARRAHCAHPPDQPARHARADAPAGQHPSQGRLGARLCAVSWQRDAVLRRRRGPPQRHRHDCRLDVDARHARCRQGVLHDRPPDQRNGHEVGADRRADHRLAQRRHRHGPCHGAESSA